MAIRVVVGLVVALWAHGAVAQPVTPADRSGTITTGGTSQTLMEANPARHGCVIQNLSVSDLWFSDLGVAAAATQPAMRILPGAFYACSDNHPSALKYTIFGATTGQAFHAREW